MEDYYSYQTQSAGHAGTAYVGDYTSQITVVKPLVSYSSTSMPYELGMVYNTAYSDGYFTNGGDTHSKNFTNMILGKGWKLTAQETVVPVSVTDMQGTASYLVHNDSDGTEHYFKETSSGSGQYEDEDGLNLTITKSGSSYTMTDKKSNKKYFKNGCLTYVEDANGNKIHIVYNNGTYSSNTVNASGANRITSIVSEPKSGTVKKLFDLAYDSSLLSSITSYNDHAIDNLSKKIEFGYTGDSTGKYQLTQISRRAYVKPDENTTGAWGTSQTEAQYSYYDDSVNGNHRMKRIYDAENRYGIEYSHIKSDTGFRVYAWHEYTVASVNAAQTTGAKVRTWNTQLRQTRYRDAGEDRILTDAADPTAVSDDVVTTYFFNSSGQTINARSETHQGDLLGVSASAYTKNSSSNTKKNNRISASISSGQAGVNIIDNGGMEIDADSDGTADGWAYYVSLGSAVCALDDSNTAGANYSGKRHYELTGNSTSAVSSIFQDIDVVQGNTYTFSAYVNTRGVTAFAENDGSVYLYVRRSSDQSLQAKSIHLANVTEEKLDNGWQRLSATFTAERTEKLRFTICSYHTAGKVLVDDVQIEKGSAASRFNHVVNGSFEKAGNNWTVSTNKTGTLTVRTDAHIHGNVSLLMAPVAPETSMCAAQTIPLNKSSDTTFLLSAWSLGDSIPDLESEIAGKTDVSLRYWGLTLTLNYADGTKDEYNLPFCDYATNWQYAAMSVTPKCTTVKIIKTADLKIYYQNNANAAYFDNISLIEEPAQTYKYDDKGNLQSVKSSGNGEDGYKYDDKQNLMEVATEGSGKYEYKYENANKHLPTKIINDTVTMGLDYDANGQTIKTTLSNSKDSLSMTSHAAYSDGLMTSVTDNTGAVTTYGYDVRRRANMVKDADDTSDTAVRTNYDDVWDRVSGTYIYNVVSVGNTYANGNLTNIARNGYHNGTKYTQNYDYAYDSFGNLTRMSIGGVRIADYGYNSGNGSLDHIYYGFTVDPLASVSYGYDPLGRMVTESWYDPENRKSKVYGYNYSSDGNLAGITENGELAYSYDYDSLGRLIQSSRIEDGKRVLYTDHQYDTSDRILSQSWQIGDKGWEEAYTYNDKDGTLSQMTVTGGDKLTFGYDNLKRLSSKTLINEQSGGTSLLKVDYGYHTEGNSTTTQIETMRFTKPDNASVARIPQLTYSYDAVGNITKVLSGSSILAEYTYDSRGQLLSEDDGKYYTTYTYDTYGNIRSAWVRASEDHTFVYGVYNYTYNDNGLWKDQLKGYSYQNYYGDISSFSGNLTYDVLGNPLTYFNGNKTWNFTWQYGRQLASASDGTHTITNEYDVDGVRESKTVDGVKHDYITLDGKIIRETYGNTTVDYFYDNEGKPYKLQVSEGNGTYTGYYILNQQGDVIAILNANGVKVVSYEYNAWGKVVDEASYDSITGPLFLEHNSLKYRGYYYDADLGLYYLGSRFYDQNICRFVNADTTDVLMANPSSLTDKNLYSYCDNNPVMRKDDDGEFWNIAAGAIIGGVISAGVELGTQLLTTGKVDLISIGIAAAGGALSGALASTSFGKVRQVVGNAVISGLSEAASQWKDGNRDIVSIAKNAGAMAFVGGISGVIGDPGIKAKGTTYRKSLDTLSSVKNNISKALSNPKGYRHQINSAIKKHISVSRTAVKNTTKSFVKATIFGNIVGKFKSWFRR